MARIRAILGALITALRRDLRSVGSFSGNNLFLVGIVFLFLQDFDVLFDLSAFIALILYIPLSADPLRVLPRDRLAIWPVSTGELRFLRMVSPWLNPVTWLVVALVIWKHASIGFCAVAVGTFANGFLLPSVPAASNGVWRRLANFPSPLNHLIRKNLREMLSTLDFWCSVLVSALALGFRTAGLLPRDAFLPLTILVMLALSTYAQTLFGFDGDGGMTRYQLLPDPAWQILAAKDIPFVLLAWAATVAELSLGVALIVGVWLRWTAFGAAVLLFLFGAAMTISFGIKSPLDYSVFLPRRGRCYLAFLPEKRTGFVSAARLGPRYMSGSQSRGRAGGLLAA